MRRNTASWVRAKRQIRKYTERSNKSIVDSRIRLCSAKNKEVALLKMSFFIRYHVFVLLAVHDF